jgi:proline racemase
LGAEQGAQFDPQHTPEVEDGPVRLSNMITAVDAHACGEPGRVITGGVLDVPGKTMFEKMTFLEQHADGLRKRMLREPRGYPAMCCNVILPPTDPAADAGFVIMEQTEYPAMSGTNTICVTTVLLETGMLPAREPVTELTLETPAGLIGVRADVSHGKVTNVTFENVPAFATHLDATVDVPTLGPVTVDVAWGGMFYVIADADALGIELVADEGKEIARLGEMIRAAAAEQLPVVHPDNPAMAGISISQLSGPPVHPDAHRRNAVVVSTGTGDWDKPHTWGGALDRSPCGTGTCAKMAVLHAKGQLGLNEDFCHESVLGTLFTGRLIREAKVGEHAAVVPTLSGRAWITSLSHYVIDDEDPFPEGFTVGDIWGRVS